MKAVASKVTEKSDVLLLNAVDMEDSGPYEIAEPRVITALETYTPSCAYFFSRIVSGLANEQTRAPNASPETHCRNCVCPGNGSTRKT